MNTIEFSGTIKKGQIILPKQFSTLENRLVKVTLVVENDKNINKKNLLKVFDKMKTTKMFSNIENPILWQKQIRDEWE